MSGLVSRVKSVLKRKPRQRPTSKVYEHPEHEEGGHGGAPASVGYPQHDHNHPQQHQNHPAHNHEPHKEPQHHHHPHHGDHPNHGAHHPSSGQHNVPSTTTPATSTGQLTVQLHNESTSDQVYAYITGSAIDNNNALFLLSSDARTPYYPPSPAAIGSPIGENISIPLGAPGNIVNATIPFIAGGRVWFSIGKPLVFALNPGPALVEPSVFNETDPNINTSFGFCEFTFNNSQLFANISYVDFVGLPIALSLRETTGGRQHVSGIPANGLQTIANGLRAQTAKDGQRWSSLIVNNKNGQLLRIFSPNSGILLNPSWFQNYWTSYVDQVYGKYASQPLTIDTQAAYGDVNGTSGGSGTLNFGAGGAFNMPSAGDIFSNSTGPFATGGNQETNAIIPRLAAAFNRSTLLLSSNQPDGVTHAQYYTNPITNHYARIVHEANLDGHGYAFPYDDVTPDGGVPQEGAVFSGTPTLMRATVGGTNAHVG